MSKLFEVFLSGTTPKTDDDGLLWKEILPEGESAYTPTAAGPLKRPFKVVGSGPGDLGSGVASLEDIKTAFDDGAFENVQVILASKKKDPETGEGGDHDEITANNTGFVRKLRIDEENGKKSLWAGIEFTEPEVKGKCERGTFANCSAGILGDVTNFHTGKKYRQALRHLSITNSPWVGGIKKFGSQIMASDDAIDSVAEVNLDNNDIINALTPEPEVDNGDNIIWSDVNSSDWLKERVNENLQKLVDKAAPDAEVHFWVKDVAPGQNTALVVQDGNAGNGNTFVVPYTVEDNSLSISTPDKWTQTRQVHIAASAELSDDQLKQRVQNALHYYLGLGKDYKVETVGKEKAVVRNDLADASWEVGWDLSANQIWLDPTDEWTRSTGTVEPRPEDEENNDGGDILKDANLSTDDQPDSSPRGVLIAARKERGLQGDENNTGGKKVAKKLDLNSLNLSDDQRTALEAQLAEPDEEAQELERLRKEKREREVNDKIAELSAAGLEDNPGVLKYVKAVLVSDDQKPSILLSEDGSGTPAPKSVTEIFDGFFALLKNQQGKLSLTTQSADLSADDEHGRPPDTPADENITHEDRLKAAAEELGLPVSEPVNR
jgi:hypothetical protein